MYTFMCMFMYICVNRDKKLKRVMHVYEKENMRDAILKLTDSYGKFDFLNQLKIF